MVLAKLIVSLRGSCWLPAFIPNCRRFRGDLDIVLRLDFFFGFDPSRATLEGDRLDSLGFIRTWTHHVHV